MAMTLKTGLKDFNNKIKYALLTIAILSGFAALTAFAGEPAQDSNSAALMQVQDNNSINIVSPAVPETPQTGISANLTKQKLLDEKKRISESKDITDEEKTQINNIYDQAIAQLDQATKFEADANGYSQKRTDAPAELEKTKSDLSKMSAFTPPEVPSDMTLTQAEQKLTEATLALDQAKKNSEYWENEPKRRADRRLKIPEESNTAQQTIDDIDKKIAAAQAEPNPTELSKANLILLQAQKKALKAQIDANTQELLSYDARRDLLSAKRDSASRQLAFAQKQMEFWQKTVSDIRLKEAQAAQKEAEKTKEQTKPSTPEIIQKVIDENVKLTAELTQLTQNIDDTGRINNQLDEDLDSIKKDFKDTQNIIAGNKISPVMGVILLNKRNELLKARQSKPEFKNRLKEITDAQLNLYKYDNEWSELYDVDQYAYNLIKTSGVSLTDSESQTLITQLKNKKNTLETLKDRYLSYFSSLQNFDRNEKDYVSTVKNYMAFIDANLLWVKTSSTFNVTNIPEIGAAVQWLISSQNWKQTAGYLWTDFKRYPISYLGIVALFVLSLTMHHKMHVMIDDLSKKVSDVTTDSFKHTLKVALLTVLLAVTWPILTLFLYWRLSLDTTGSIFIQAIKTGLLYMTYTIFSLEVLRHITMPLGLMSDHFRVRDEALETIRNNLRWLFVIIIPLMFVFKVFQVQQEESYYNSAGRLIFIIMLVFLAIFLLRLLRLNGPVTGPFIKRHPDGWIARFRYIWFPLCLILPVGFAVTATLGYFYAAKYLSEKFLLTILLVMVVVFFKALLTRWLLVTRRKLALIERQKREAEAAAQEEAKEASEQPKQAEISLQPQSQAKPEKTIFEISKQTNRLINAVIFILIVIGLWYIWQDALPALNALGNIVVWHKENVTLGAFVTAIIIIIMTVITARNVPGLLEIVVLRKLPMDVALRFAITTVSRYILVIVGVVLAFTKIGIGWSKVQWLVAAITVGLGFGLQEIFANFISGLIILFEQPIRVDDVVTVGDVTGIVTKIKIRATTIRKWDQRELIVPNKEFITGHLINWTLSDNILRRDFIVGIAYGSDVAKAEKTLYDIAASDPAVLENPKPIVLFKSFGDSSLEFELRVYISGIENYLPVWHRINCEIDSAFRKAGIEISFPQRDIHIRSIETKVPLDIEKMPKFD